MPWVWPHEIDAVRRGLRGQYGGQSGNDFDRGIDRLIMMIQRWDKDPFGKPKRVAIDNASVAACAKTLVALSTNPDFSAGVIAMVAALLPPSYLRDLARGNNGSVETA